MGPWHALFMEYRTLVQVWCCPLLSCVFPFQLTKTMQTFADMPEMCFHSDFSPYPHTVHLTTKLYRALKLLGSYPENLWTISEDISSLHCSLWQTSQESLYQVHMSYLYPNKPLHRVTTLVIDAFIQTQIWNNCSYNSLLIHKTFY